MKLRDAMTEAMKRTNTHPDVIKLSLLIADRALPESSLSSHGQIQSGQEEICIQKLIDFLEHNDEQALDFCESQVIKPDN